MRALIVMGMLFGLYSMAWAIEPGPASKAQQQTETWLQLQVKGSAASKIPQTATPTEREQSQQRWLDSNTHKIPEFFDQEQGGKVTGDSR